MDYISILNFKYYMKANMFAILYSLKNSLKNFIFLFTVTITSILLYKFASLGNFKEAMYFFIYFLLLFMIFYFIMMFIFMPLLSVFIYIFSLGSKEKINRYYITEINNTFISESTFSSKGTCLKTTTIETKNLYKILIHKKDLYIFVNKYSMQILSRDLLIDGDINEIIAYYIYNFPSKIERI